jgi:hypothetical protein
MAKVMIECDTETGEMSCNVNGMGIPDVMSVSLRKYDNEEKPYIDIYMKPIDIGGIKYNAYVSTAELNDTVIKNDNGFYLKADRSKVKCLFTKQK